MADHPLQAIQIGDVRQLRAHRFVARTKPLLADQEDGLLGTLFLSFVEDHQVGIGFVHESTSRGVQDLLPICGLRGAADHPVQARQVRDLLQSIPGRLFGLT